MNEDAHDKEMERLDGRDWACVAVVTFATVLLWVVCIAWVVRTFRGWE